MGMGRYPWPSPGVRGRHSLPTRYAALEHYHSDIDTALMNAVGQLDDVFARVAIIVLRHTGIRIGELLDLEIRHLVDYGHNGTRAAGAARETPQRTPGPRR